MIKRLHIKNFKALRDVSVDLTPIHALIGQNDSGKSSILQALYAIVQSTGQRIDECFRGRWTGRELVWNGASTREVELGVTVSIRNRNIEYGLNFAFGESGRDVHITEEHVGIDGKFQSIKFHSHATALYELASATPPPTLAKIDIELAQSLRGALAGVHLHWWDPRFLSLPAPLDSRQRFRMDPTGLGLPRCLDDILSYDRDLFIRLEQRFIEFFPQFRSIKLRAEPAYRNQETASSNVPILQQPTDGKGVAFELADNGAIIPASQTSDGVLVILAYLTILHLPEPPRVILVEEPENAIHPQRLGEVIRILRDIIHEQAHTQILMTTHSPYLVDEFAPEEVTVCWKGNDGAVGTRQLSTVPIVHRESDIFRLGEIWTSEGDQALFEGKPAKPEKR
jgi:ABC-type branched-subunit amino acid transport system ATPase component